MKFFCRSLFLNFLICSSLFAQTAQNTNEGTERKMAVTLNVGIMPIGFFEGSYQLKMAPTVLLTTTASWYDYRAALKRFYSPGYGPFLGFGSRVHVSGVALDQGLFLEPSLKLGYIIHPTDVVNPNGNFMTRFGVSMGYTHVLSCGFVIEGSAGLDHYYQFGVLGDKKIVGGKRAFVRPLAQASIGYAW